MEFDEVLGQIGEFGKSQKIVYFTVCLASAAAGLSSMGAVFITAVPDHWCAAPELSGLNISEDTVKNITLPRRTKDGQERYSRCDMYDVNYTGWSKQQVLDNLLLRNTSQLSETKCRSGWAYDKSGYSSTIVTQWDLVCDNRWLASTAISISSIGTMLGVLVFGFVSDRFGRRPVLFGTLFCTSVISVAQAFSSSVYVFSACRVLVGAFGAAFYATSFIIAIELVGPTWREFAGMITMFYWAVGCLLTGGVAYMVRAWWTLQIALSSGMFLCFIYFFLIPESVRWLYVNGREEEGEKVLRRYAKVNGKTLPDKLNIIIKTDKKKANAIDLVRGPRLRRVFIYLFVIWWVNGFVYTGLSFNIPNLRGNLYVNFTISAAVEVPAYLLCMFLLKYAGRRISTCVTMATGGLALLATRAVPVDFYTLSIALAMTGKFCITASFAIIYVFSAELFPTVVRHVGMGAVSFGATAGGMIAPFIAQLSSTSEYIPPVLFGGASLAAGLLAFMLLETKGKHLPETLTDAENFGKNARTEYLARLGSLLPKGVGLGQLIRFLTKQR